MEDARRRRALSTSHEDVEPVATPRFDGWRRGEDAALVHPLPAVAAVRPPRLPQLVVGGSDENVDAVRSPGDPRRRSDHYRRKTGDAIGNPVPVP